MPTPISTQEKDPTELLIQDYKYAQESFWKSESLGETRVNILTGIVAAVTAGVFALLGKHIEQKNDLLHLPDSVVFISVFAFAAVLLLGLATLLRLLKRNEVTDGYKKDMDDIRQRLKKIYNSGILDYYSPFGAGGSAGKRKEIRKFGGLAHLVALLNSIVAAGLAGMLSVRSVSDLLLTGCIVAFVLLTVLMTEHGYIKRRDKASKQQLLEARVTHAGGVVYKKEGTYLLVNSSDGKFLVFPKGHIERDMAESAEMAAVREIKEETGVIASQPRYLDIVCFSGKQEDVVCKYFLMKYQDEHEAQEPRNHHWLSFDQAKKQLVLKEQLDLLLLARRAQLR